MKKFIYILIIFVVFIVHFDVYADYVMPTSSLSNRNYNIECIYSDGSLISYEWSVGKDNFIHNRLTYNLVGADNTETNSGGNIAYSNNLMVVDIKDYESWVMFCPNQIYSTTFRETLYYKFRFSFHCDDENCSDFNIAGDSGWCKFWGCDSGDISAAKLAEENENESVLYSERFVLKNTAEEPNATIYYMMPAEQASGVNTYIKIMVYDNVVLLEKDGIVTKLDGELVDNEFSSITTTAITDKNGKVVKYINNGIKTKTIYLNSPEPNPVTNSSSSVAYSFNQGQIRYSVSSTQDATHKYKYVYTEDVPVGASIDDSLCTERLKNTSPILKWIIQVMTIGVPVFVIILTSIDIGKLVIAGNLEEELPKRKKIIMYRLIVMVAFFFLPLIATMLLNMVKISGGADDKNAIVNFIADIGCLFESDNNTSDNKTSGTGSNEKPIDTNKDDDFHHKD